MVMLVVTMIALVSLSVRRSSKALSSVRNAAISCRTPMKSRFTSKFLRSWVLSVVRRASLQDTA